MGVVRRALSKYKGVRASVSGGTDISARRAPGLAAAAAGAAAEARTGST